MAQTAGYFHAAYIVAGTLYVLYTVSLVVRRRRVLQRIAALERGAER
ncbi:MAG TPA: hypothetical protein VFP15_12865 [Gemmatimonadaceae bacterium]|jgi:hypothetical protein|nr:hypothetical protein [Gemmatimonadaceae bacterium]